MVLTDNCVSLPVSPDDRSQSPSAAEALSHSRLLESCDYFDSLSLIPCPLERRERAVRRLIPRLLGPTVFSYSLNPYYCPTNAETGVGDADTTRATCLSLRLLGPTWHVSLPVRSDNHDRLTVSIAFCSELSLHSPSVRTYTAQVSVPSEFHRDSVSLPVGSNVSERLNPWCTVWSQSQSARTSVNLHVSHERIHLTPSSTVVSLPVHTLAMDARSHSPSVLHIRRRRLSSLPSTELSHSLLVCKPEIRWSQSLVWCIKSASVSVLRSVGVRSSTTVGYSLLPVWVRSEPVRTGWSGRLLRGV